MNTHHPLPATLRRIALVLLAGTATVLLGTGTAWAHTELETSSPATGAQLDRAPTEVTLTFSEAVPADSATITVRGPDGADHVRGPVTASAGVLTVPLAPLGAAGDYAVEYRVVSDDGHPVAGTVPFTLTARAVPTAAAAPATPAPTSATTPPAATTGVPEAIAGTAEQDDGAPVWPWVLVAVVVIGAGAAFALRRTWS